MDPYIGTNTETSTNSNASADGATDSEPRKRIPGRAVPVAVKRRKIGPTDPIGTAELVGINRIWGAEVSTVAKSPPPEMQDIIEQSDRDFQALINEIAAGCKSHISMLKMQATTVRPLKPFFFEQVVFRYEESGWRPGEKVYKEVTWYLPYLLRDGAFEYLPWDVRGVMSAFPGRMQEVLHRALMSDKPPTKLRDDKKSG